MATFTPADVSGWLFTIDGLNAANGNTQPVPEPFLTTYVTDLNTPPPPATPTATPARTGSGLIWKISLSMPTHLPPILSRIPSFARPLRISFCVNFSSRGASFRPAAQPPRNMTLGSPALLTTPRI